MVPLLQTGKQLIVVEFMQYEVISFSLSSAVPIEQHILEEGYMHKNQPIIVPGVNWPGLGVEVSIGMVCSVII